MNICTIIAKNYIAHARVLAKSFREHHPDGACTVLLIDDPEGTIDAGAEPFEILRVEEIDVPEWHKAVARHDIAGLSSTVKPWLLKYLLERGANHVAYFDSDIQIFAPLDDIGELAEKHGIVLTPHTIEPIPRDKEKPTEHEVLSAGVYNLGFIAVGAGETSTRFLDWWSEGVLKNYSVEKPRQLFIDQQLALVQQPQALFADQRLVDVVPSLFPSTKILQDPGCNVAYWNLHARTLERDGAVITVNGQRLRFFHFSGFRPELPYWLSKNATRVKVSENPVLGELCRSYAALLEEHGYKDAIRVPYGYRQLPNGIPYDDRLRRLYMEAVADGEDFGDIFELEGAEAFLGWLNAPSEWGGHHGVTRFMHHGVYDERSDVWQEFKDLSGPGGANFVRWFVREGRYQYDDLPDQLIPADPDSPQGTSEPQVIRAEHIDEQLPVDLDSPRSTSESRVAAEVDGVNVVGYFTGETGLGEVARQNISALKSVGIPVATKTFVHSWNINKNDFVDLDSPKEYSTNLICLQPLHLREFYKQAGEEFFNGRRSIGVWGWELNVLPEEYLVSLEHVDEVWVWTSYVAEALSRVTSKPVAVVPPPVVIPDSGDTSVDLGIPEGFTFLFLFDFHSVVSRKNPLGLVEAFKRAFAPGEGPQLVIKSINGDVFPQLFEQLKVAALDRPDIHIVDRYLSSREKTALMASCDCYVSLHRSEGFGLTPAEAMALGKPVIATGFSGNTDFMTSMNSYLVDYTLTEVGPGCPPYPAEGLWAEPDLDHAASLMRHVWENPDDARARGERARQDIERTLSPEAVGEIMRARLERLAESTAVPTSPPAEPTAVSTSPPEQSGGARSTEAGDAGRKSRANQKGKLRVVQEMLEQGPAVEAPSRLGRIGRLARRLVLRGMRPFTSYQGQLDAAMIGALREAQSRLVRQREHLQETTQKTETVQSSLMHQQERLERLEALVDDGRERDDAIEGQLIQTKWYLDALERGATEEMRRLDADLSRITSGLRAKPNISNPLLGYTDESGKVVLGFRDAGDGFSESDTYSALEDVFRGDERAVKNRQAWYADVVADHSWLLNVGCGRGEFLDLLRDRGIKGKGVESDEIMVSRCHDKGHDVVLSDANVYLREQDDGSIPAIFATQTVVERLSYEDLLEFLRLANAKLQAEGLLILEAVNYHSLEALKTFWLDPSKRRPVLPETALALCRLAGFKSGRVVLPNRSDNLKKELFSAHDYAVLATKTASDPVAEREKMRHDALVQKRKSSNLRLCKVCDLPDWEDEEFQTILDELEFQAHLDESGYSRARERKHRKGWEWAQGIRGLKHLGALKPEAVAIGVGAGHEPPLYYLANHIREVHATDIYGSGAFVWDEGLAGMLTNPEKFAPFFYREDHLVVEYMDGCNLKYPDNSFDIAFSFSSIEHFGEGHRDASRAMREIARVLRPGGTAVITTELILNDASHPEFFRPEELYEYLVRPSGLELVEDIDFTISPSLLENPVDLDTDYKDVFPHIVLRQGPVVWTSVIMFLQKPA